METVLIVEDDPTMLRGLKDNFEFKGYRVVTAADGEEGLNAALDNNPDLILLDIMLPKINGYEVCRLIRQEQLEMPIIMLTAKGQESDIVLGLNLGARGRRLCHQAVQHQRAPCTCSGVSQTNQTG
jgi:DNA-binding response OmpR family regulator